MPTDSGDVAGHRDPAEQARDRHDVAHPPAPAAGPLHAEEAQREDGGQLDRRRDDDAAARRPGGCRSSSRSPARRPISKPASIRPIMSASLWMPLTRWNSTSGLAAPSHSARPVSSPQRRASLGSAHTISAEAGEREQPVLEDARAPRRCRDSAVIPRPRIRKSGPYGAGVSRQIVGMLRVSGSSTPSASAGPSTYGSSPRASDGALREVAVDVAGEQRRCHGERQGPHHGGAGQLRRRGRGRHGAAGAQHLARPTARRARADRCRRR